MGSIPPNIINVPVVNTNDIIIENTSSFEFYTEKKPENFLKLSYPFDPDHKLDIAFNPQKIRMQI